VTDTGLDAAELAALRQEITSHFTLSSTLVAVELAALGAGLSVLDSSTHILAGLAAISSFLWLLWLDHSGQILKIAAYLALELAPRMSTQLGRPVLVWEVFLRRLNAGGTAAAGALHGRAPLMSRSIVRPLRAEWYSPLLFGAAPPLLLSLYVTAGLQAGKEPVVVWTAAATAALLWAFAVSRFIDFMHNAKATTGPSWRTRMSARHPAIRRADPDPRRAAAASRNGSTARLAACECVHLAGRRMLGPWAMTRRSVDCSRRSGRTLPSESCRSPTTSTA